MPLYRWYITNYNSNAFNRWMYFIFMDVIFLKALQTLSKMHSHNKECNNAFLYAHTSLLFLLLIKYTY